MMPESNTGRSFSFSVMGKAASRLDRFLAEQLQDEGLSREKVKRAILDGTVCINGNTERSPKKSLQSGDTVTVELALTENQLVPEEGEIDVLYHDNVLAVINKPAGVTVHPAPGIASGTLVHRLLSRFPELAEQEGFRPGIVHRLDKDTSGLMLVALTEEARLRLSALFAEHAIYKEYLALVCGIPAKKQEFIDAPIARHPTHKTKMAVVQGGKSAQSERRSLLSCRSDMGIIRGDSPAQAKASPSAASAGDNRPDSGAGFSLEAVRIFSGRTHQVRVHMQHVGHPLVGDSVYTGAGEKYPRPDPAVLGATSRQMLHAWKLSFTHPLPEYIRMPENTQAARALNEGARGNHFPLRGIEQNPTSNSASLKIMDTKHSALRGNVLLSRDGDTLSFCCPPPQDFLDAVRVLSGRLLKVVVTGLPGCGKSAVTRMLREKGVPVFSADAEVAKLYEPGADGYRMIKARFGDRFIAPGNMPVDKKALASAMLQDSALRREVESLLHPLVGAALHNFWLKQEKKSFPLAIAEIPLYLESGWAGFGKNQSADRNIASEHNRNSTSESSRNTTLESDRNITLESSRNTISANSWKSASGDNTIGNDALLSRIGQRVDASPIIVGVQCPFSVRNTRLSEKRGWSDEMIAAMESWQWPEEKKMAACDLVIANTGTLDDLHREATRLHEALETIARQQAEATASEFVHCWESCD